MIKIKRMERYANSVDGFLYEDLEVDYNKKGNEVSVTLYWTEDGETKSKLIATLYSDMFDGWVYNGEGKSAIIAAVKRMCVTTEKEPEVKYHLIKNENKIPVYDLKEFAIKKKVSLSALADVVTGKVDSVGGYYSEASWEAHKEYLAKRAEKASKKATSKADTKPFIDLKGPVDADVEAEFDAALEKVLNREKSVKERSAKRKAKKVKAKAPAPAKTPSTKAPKQPRKELHTVPTYNVASKSGMLKAIGYKSRGRHITTLSFTVFRYEDDTPLTITNIRAFAKEHGLCSVNVYSLKNGKNKYIQSKTTGEVFYREGGKPKTFVISHKETGKKVMFWNIKQACDENGISYSSLAKLTAGDRKSAQGWVLL